MIYLYRLPNYLVIKRAVSGEKVDVSLKTKPSIYN